MTTSLTTESTRRTFLGMAAFAVAGLCLTKADLFAQEENLVVGARRMTATAKLELQHLRGNVSVISGAGGNIAILPGPDGKLLVDSGILNAQLHIDALLSRLGPDPLRHLINTHWHFDHTDGNDWAHDSGATILAHINTRKHLSEDTRVEGWDFTFPRRRAGAVPTETFDRDHTVQLNGATLKLEHYPPAHTDSDISVYFAEADILHAGDTFWNGSYPFIDYSTGGSIDGQIRAAEANLARATDKMIVIPGHGAVGGRAELTLFRDVLTEMREKISILKKEGRTLNEIVAAKPGAKYDAQWGQSFMTPSAFVALVYQGV